MFLYPLFLPVIAAVVGGFIAYVAFSRLGEHRVGGRGVVPALIVSALASSALPNIEQILYDSGLSMVVIEGVSRLSYAVFGFCVVGAWLFLKQSRKRWLLMTLIPISFAQPLLWTFAFLVWSVKGFAP
ncbi:MAG: hypothetical protein IPK65_00030 [Gammaproteobacteria bacterium]|nr:hypothetical protein [Gammaproteobacteria bacterium]